MSYSMSIANSTRKFIASGNEHAKLILVLFGATAATFCLGSVSDIDSYQSNQLATAQEERAQQRSDLLERYMTSGSAEDYLRLRAFCGPDDKLGVGRGPRS